MEPNMKTFLFASALLFALSAPALAEMHHGGGGYHGGGHFHGGGGFYGGRDSGNYVGGYGYRYYHPHHHFHGGCPWPLLASGLCPYQYARPYYEPEYDY